MLSYQQFLKSVVCCSVLMMAAFGFTSCGNKSDVQVSQAAVAQVNPADLTIENDKRFLNEAVEMKYQQVMLGKLAQQRSSNEELKALAKSIEEANRTDKSALASLAIMKSISVPGAPPASAQAAYDTLNKATVEDFDFAYVRFVIEGYTQSISHFENAATASIDKDIQAKAASMLPDMRSHLGRAKEMDTRMNPVSELVRE